MRKHDLNYLFERMTTMCGVKSIIVRCGNENLRNGDRRGPRLGSGVSHHLPAE